MKECHRWNAALPCDPQRAPGRMKCVAGLDEIRLQRIEQLGPAARGQRQSIVECARDDGPCDGAYFAGLQFCARTGHQQRMTPCLLSRIPLVLGVEIAPHTTTRRRVKQCCIDEMHPCSLGVDALQPARGCLVKAWPGEKLPPRRQTSPT